MNRSIRLGLGGVAAVAAVAAVSLAGLGTGAGTQAAVATTTSTPPPGASVVPATVPAEPDGWPGTITVTGSGSVDVTPDVATINLGVQANAATSAGAMSQLSEQSQELTDALEAAGVAPEDVQTSGLSLWSRTSDDGTEVVGYDASLQITATVRDIDQVGGIIDRAQQAVGDGFTIGGVSFSFSDPESVLEPARVDAFGSARATASQYAAAAGVELGSVLAISEGSSPGPVPYPTVMMDDVASPASLSVSPGSLDIGVTVTVTFAIAS